jgi:hypothetical protein
MAAKDLLNNLTVAAPCTADWNSMSGNDQVRFCEHCSLAVHNISQMTQPQAARLVARSKGRLCVRYCNDSQGRPLSLPAQQKLHRLGRRVSQIAAGAFSATLSLTTAVAQSSVSVQSGNLNASGVAQSIDHWSPGASLVGTIKDQAGALIPTATISVTNEDLNLALYVSTGWDGEFRLDHLPAAGYKLRIEAPGFAPLSELLYLRGNDEARIDRTLSVATIEETVAVEDTREVVTMGSIVITSPANSFVRAAQENDLEALTALIAGVDVNLRDQQTGTTALEHAVRNANREMVQLLLAAGANVNAKNSGDETVLMMLDDDATSDLVWDLLNSGADVNQKDSGGNTALMQVASTRNLEALKTLLDAGAKINERNKLGKTALMIAASEGQVHIVRALVLAGADINAVDKEKSDALAQAIENDHEAVIRFLKSKGAVETSVRVEEVAEN